MERAILLFGCYRAGEANDPQIYTTAIAAVLAQFEAAIVSTVTDPRAGIARQIKFLPSVAEVSGACEDEAARAERIRRYAEMGGLRRLPRPKQHRANVFVPPHAPQYLAMVEKAKAKTTSRDEWRHDAVRPGIWVALGWLDEDEAAAAKSWRQFTGSELMAIYGQPAYGPTEEVMRRAGEPPGA